MPRSDTARKRAFREGVLVPLASIVLLVLAYVVLGWPSEPEPGSADPDMSSDWGLELIFAAVIAWQAFNLAKGIRTWQATTDEPPPVRPSRPADAPRLVREDGPNPSLPWLALFERHGLIDAAAEERIATAFHVEYGSEGDVFDLLSATADHAHAHGPSGSLRSIHSNVEAHEGNYGDAVILIDAVLGEHLQLRLVAFDAEGGTMDLDAGGEPIHASVETSGKWLDLEWVNPLGEVLAARTEKRLAAIVVDADFHFFLLDRGEWRRFSKALGKATGFVVAD